MYINLFHIANDITIDVELFIYFLLYVRKYIKVNNR